MTIERIAPILTVDDLDAAITEHTRVLGMHVVMNMGWVAFHADDAGSQPASRSSIRCPRKSGACAGSSTATRPDT